MYNILELKDKDLDELQSIAREMSLESTSFSNKDELVYAILDQQAINMAEKRNAVKESQVATKRSEKSLQKLLIPIFLKASPRSRHGDASRK